MTLGMREPCGEREVYSVSSRVTLVPSSILMSRIERRGLSTTCTAGAKIRCKHASNGMFRLLLLYSNS
jgi:hypothetical protein